MKDHKTLSRREFIERFSALGGCFAVSAHITACQPSTVSSGASARYSFPQGIASADPQPDAVMLWTRIVDSQSDDAVPTTVEVSASEDFSDIIVSESLTANAESDFTLRCFVAGLDSNRWYWYRFVTADGYASQIGRTRTAPAPDADVELRIAMLSCQSYESGYFNAYRRLVIDDMAADPADQIDVCIHVGDFIYENVNGGSFTAEEGNSLRNADGVPRSAGDLPSGGVPRGVGNQILPVTVDDYRWIYKSYLSDMALQDARARFPFICIWDDHEVLNDYWQAYSPGGPVQTRKVAGNQAWFEYIPAVLNEAQDGPAGPNPARDFESAEVSDTPQGAFDSDYLSTESNTRTAIDTMTIYRTLRWGRRAEIILTDGRSYRGPRGLDAAILGTELLAYPAAPLDPELIRVMNAGETANGGNPPETLEYEGETIPNPRINSPRSSMFGAVQKQWLKDTLTTSDARWKLLCNNVPMVRFGFDTRFKPAGTPSSVYWTDSWDGYPVERQELMEFILESRITNTISVTGDRHAHYAGFVYDDYDSPNAQAVIPELIGAGISQQDRFSIQMRLFRRDPELLARTGFDGASINYPTPNAPAMNAWFLYGHECALRLSETADADAAMEVADPGINPHLVYADSDAYGYYTLRVTEDAVESEFVVIPAPRTDESSGTPTVYRRVRMRAPAWEPGDTPTLTDIEVEGTQPIVGFKPARA